MVTTPIALPQHSAPIEWTPAQRNALEAALQARGCTITLLSDARELLGFDRLSDASPADRASALDNLECPAVQTALVQARTCRAWLVEQLKEVPKRTVQDAKATLGLRTRRGALKGTADLRLGELAALVGVATAPAPRTYGATLHPVWSEEELFGGAVGL
jgi:hypothetical protein